MPHTAKEGAARTITDLVIIVSGIALFKNNIIQTFQCYSWPTFLHEKHFKFYNCIEKLKTRSFDGTTHNQFPF